MSHLVTRLKEYQNNPKLASMKEQFLKGGKPIECSRCWQEEDAGLPSKRQLDWQQIYNKQAPADDGIRVAMLTFGNSCNLTCRTCGSYASSSWIKEEEKLFPDMKIYSHNNFYKDIEYQSELAELAKTVTHVYIVGGEPFLSTDLKYHSAFLDLLLNRADQITLKYTTNCTVTPSKEMWEKFKQFKNVEFHLSIDGTDSVYEYTRFPAKWEEVLQNIKKYQSWASSTANFKISIGHTVSILNVYYLPDFLIWCLKNKLDKPYIGMVHGPDHYNIRNLPLEIKNIITDRLRLYHANEVVSFMQEKDDQPEHF
jgi:sulfatase maturation enzyme AslB (radical SAM superfamily)